MDEVILLTGTPGTGKTAAAGLFAGRAGFTVIGVNEVVGDDYLYMEGGSRVVDLNLLSEKIRGLIHGRCVVEGHLAHLLGIEGLVIVLRCHPKELEKRLARRGFSGKKLEENLEAEALDVCLVESLQRQGRVYEIDTTGLKPEEVAEAMLRIWEGYGGDFKPGRISWLEEYLEQ
ncbi:MAG: NMP kinase [Methanobacteriota archaeon]|nr:MAG: NMP kinase [Euryarchaeota archaeon]